MPNLNPKGKNMEFKLYVANSRNNWGSLDVEDNGGVGGDTLKPRDEDDDGHGNGGGDDPLDHGRDYDGARGDLEPDLGDEKEEVRSGGGDNKVAKMKWRTILSGNQTEKGSILKLKNTKKMKRGA